jgi:hypothetical protein
MRHDSPQGESIGFWFHLGFAAMYALAFAWHLKGAREHARDIRHMNIDKQFQGYGIFAERLSGKRADRDI